MLKMNHWIIIGCLVLILWVVVVVPGQKQLDQPKEPTTTQQPAHPNVAGNTEAAAPRALTPGPIVKAQPAPDWLNSADPRLQPEPMPANQDEARRWGLKHIQPILDNARNDSLPVVQELIAELFKRLKTGRVGLGMVLDMPQNVTAATRVNSKGEVEVLFNTQFLFILSKSLPPDQFRDEVIAAACHETLHLIHTPMKEGEEFSREKHTEAEMKVVAVTVKRVTRPMMEAGRFVSPFNLLMSESFRACGDDAKSKKWKDWIEQNYRFDTIPKKE